MLRPAQTPLMKYLRPYAILSEIQVGRWGTGGEVNVATKVKELKLDKLKIIYTQEECDGER